MKPSIKILLLSSFVLLGSEMAWAYDAHHPNPMSILNGKHHHRSSRKKPRKTISTAPKRVSKLQPWRMHKRTEEGKYIIKPEPYSIAKAQEDPELLGPQRTYTAGTSTPQDQNQTAPSPTKKHHTTITRESCIDQIGAEKFDTYVQKYGGETGALQRCRILLRAHS